jgi:O-antigen/teichoic acid export membrane protein
MYQKTKKLLTHPLISGSIIIVLGSMFANFLGLLYNIFMSRNLSLADYGTLSIIVALIGLPAVAANAVQPLIVNFAATFFAQKELDKLRGLYVKISRFIIGIDTVLFFLFLILIPQINQFL